MAEERDGAEEDMDLTRGGGGGGRNWIRGISDSASTALDLFRVYSWVRSEEIGFESDGQSQFCFVSLSKKKKKKKSVSFRTFDCLKNVNMKYVH